MLCCTWLGIFLEKIRWVWALAYLFCTCCFFYQLVQILPNYFHPTLTNTEVTEVLLKSMNFPLDFKICLGPTFNETVLKSFGYEDTVLYQNGVSKDTPTCLHTT